MAAAMVNRDRPVSAHELLPQRTGRCIEAKWQTTACPPVIHKLRRTSQPVESRKPLLLSPATGMPSDSSPSRPRLTCARVMFL